MNNGQENNNSNNNNNIVIPQSVNINNNIPQGDTMLNRERSNIVSATIQANSAIDKKQAVEVNNELKVEKHQNYMYIVVILTVIVLCTVVGFVVYKLLNGAVKYVNDDPTTTTTTITTTTPLERFDAYLRDYTKVRKFVGDDYILILSSEACDLKNNKEHYLLLHTSDEGLIEKKDGTYTIENNKVKLDNNEYEYDKDGIKYNNEVLKIYDSEMKYYQYKDDNISYLLIINATMSNEIAMFISSSKSKIDVDIQTFKETESSITLGESVVFTKVENDITYNNYTLKLIG